MYVYSLVILISDLILHFKDSNLTYNFFPLTLPPMS